MGDKVVLLATEHQRLSATASLMEGATTPAARRRPALGLSERAHAAGRQPGGLDARHSPPETIEESPSKEAVEGGQGTGEGTHLDSTRSEYSSGGRGGGASDTLNISSDQSSPFSSLSKGTSPAKYYRKFALQCCDIVL